MKNIYRVRNESDEGYLHCKFERCKDASKDFLNDGTERHQHPDADDSELGELWLHKSSDLKNYIFGFENLDHLRIWFRLEELKSLHDQGFYVYEITVPENFIIYGTRQLIFPKDQIISSKKIDINLDPGLWKDIDDKYFNL